MVPWQVEDGPKAWQTFDPAISIALANLLPSKFLNKDRLAGSRLAVLLVDQAATRGFH